MGKEPEQEKVELPRFSSKDPMLVRSCSRFDNTVLWMIMLFIIKLLHFSNEKKIYTHCVFVFKKVDFWRCWFVSFENCRLLGPIHYSCFCLEINLLRYKAYPHHKNRGIIDYIFQIVKQVFSAYWNS